MDIKLNDIPLYPFLDYFNRSIKKGANENAPVYEKAGVLAATNISVSVAGESYNFTYEIDRTNENNPSASEDNKYYRITKTGDVYNIVYMNNFTEDDMNELRAGNNGRNIIRKSIVASDLNPFPAYIYIGKTEGNMTALWNNNFNNEFHIVEVKCLINKKPKLKNGLPLYVDSNGIETTRSKYYNSFYTHQRALRDNIYKMSNDYQWMSNPRFSNNIGLLQKSNANTTYLKDNKYQFAYCIPYKETKTYSLENANSSIQPLETMLTENIYNKVSTSTFVSTSQKYEPVKLGYINDIKNVEAYMTLDNTQIGLNKDLYIPAELKENTNYLISIYWRFMKLCNQRVFISRASEINASFYCNYKIYSEYTYETYELEKFYNYDSYGHINKVYTNGTGKWVTHTGVNTTDCSIRSSSSNVSAIFGTNLKNPYIYIPFTLTDNLDNLKDAEITFTIEGVMLTGKIKTGNKISFNVSGNSSLKDAEILSHFDVTGKTKTNAFFIKLYLPKIEKELVSDIIAKVTIPSIAGNPNATYYSYKNNYMTIKSIRQLRDAAANSKNSTALMNDTTNSILFYQDDKIVNSDLINIYKYSYRIGDKFSLTENVVFNKPSVIRYYVYPIDNTKIVKEIVSYSQDINISTISTPTVNSYKLSNIIETFQNTDANDQSLFAEDIYYKLRGPYVSGEVFKNMRLNSLDKMLQDIIKSDDEHINLQELYLKESSLVDFYNYAKGIDKFIKENNNNTIDKVEDIELSDINGLLSQIILSENYYYPNYEKTNEQLYTDVEDRELLQRLSEYQKFPINEEYNKSVAREKNNQIITYGEITNKGNDELLFKLSSESKKYNFDDNTKNRPLNLIISALLEYFYSGRLSVFKDINEGMYIMAVNSLKDKVINEEDTERKKVYSSYTDNFESDFSDLLDDLLMTHTDNITLDNNINVPEDSESGTAAYTISSVESFPTKWNLYK